MSARTGRAAEPRIDPRVSAFFNRQGRRYGAADEVRLSYTVEGIGDLAVTAVERSAVWYTEGKGEEDLGIVYFERVTDTAELPPQQAAGRFGFRLPPSPLSYEGVIVKIRWCVRVRLFFAGGRDFVSEHLFEVGEIPPAMYVAGEGVMA